MLQGCVEIRNGPMEIILGGGPGTNGQVADPFQKYWGCTFANQVCELAHNKHKWSRFDDIDRLFESKGQPIKSLKVLRGG